jgi:hypothetical protein
MGLLVAMSGEARWRLRRRTCQSSVRVRLISFSYVAIRTRLEQQAKGTRGRKILEQTRRDLQEKIQSLPPDLQERTP